MKTFVNVFDHHITMNDASVLSFYRGPFVKRKLIPLGYGLLEKFKYTPLKGKRIFSIFIEMADNIGVHSGERKKYNDLDEVGYGIILLAENERGYTLSSGNIISRDATSDLLRRTSMINNASKEELRNLKFKILEDSLNETLSAGANIGLIDMALKADHPLQIHVNKLDSEYSYLMITTVINK